MRNFIAVIAVVMLTTVGAGAQKLKTISGSPKVIDGDKNINVIFTYPDLKVGKMNEEDYIKREIKEREDKEPGTGDKWAIAWKKDQADRYPEKFIELFNIHGGKLFDAAIVPDAKDSKYTMEVATTFIEPGFNVGVMRKPASTNHTIKIYETGKPEEIIHELTIVASPGTGGMGYDFDAGFRIREAFAKAAKSYAGFIYKKHIK